MITIGIFEAKASLGQLAQSAAEGEVIVLTRRGAPRVAREHFNEKMGCGARASTHAEAINLAAAIEQPNFAAIGRR